jgi:sugar lactone lactonase YvrE
LLSLAGVLLVTAGGVLSTMFGGPEFLGHFGWLGYRSHAPVTRGRMSVHEPFRRNVRCVLPWQAMVGESPVWHEQEQSLYWVDIQGKQIHRFHPASGQNQTFDLPEIVTCIALRAAGGLVLTLKKHFAIFDPATLALERLAEVESDLTQQSFQRRKVRPARPFLGRHDGRGALVRSGRQSVPAGCRQEPSQPCRQMSSVPTAAAGVRTDDDVLHRKLSLRNFCLRFRLRRRSHSNRRPFATLDSNGGGFPDGMTVDADGFVWSNVVGLGQIRRYDPNGKLERIVQLPVPRATDCTFGGPDLKTLYITTARETMTPEQLAAAPLSGSLFAVDCDVRGLPSHSFSGLNTADRKESLDMRKSRRERVWSAGYRTALDPRQQEWRRHRLFGFE